MQIIRATQVREHSRAPRSATTTPATRPPIPTHVHQDRTLRLKIINGCGMTCTFCHNEGTAVVADNVRRTNGFLAAGASGRVSVYLATNGVQFLPATVSPDAAFAETLLALSNALQLNELHLTGGEPTLHPQLSEIVRVGADTRG
jgi:cyclic pyranopterin phosphate synthase